MAKSTGAQRRLKTNTLGFEQKETPGGSWWTLYAAPETAFEVFSAAAKRREDEAGWKQSANRTAGVMTKMGL